MDWVQATLRVDGVRESLQVCADYLRTRSRWSDCGWVIQESWSLSHACLVRHAFRLVAYGPALNKDLTFPATCYTAGWSPRTPASAAGPARQLLRDVALPTREDGSAEARRHVACCPGASAPLIRAQTGGRGPHHEGTSGRGKASGPCDQLHAEAAPEAIQDGLPAPDLLCL